MARVRNTHKRGNIFLLVIRNYVDLFYIISFILNYHFYTPRTLYSLFLVRAA